MRSETQPVPERPTQSEAVKHWRNFPGVVAIIAPFAICVAIAAVFLLWFGFSTARILESSEITKQSENIALLVNYEQHLIDDALENIDDLDRTLAASQTPPDMSNYRVRRSSGHTRSMAVFDDSGRVLAKTEYLSTTRAAQLPDITGRLDRTAGPVFMPEPPSDSDDVPGFVLAQRFAARHVNILIDIAITPRDRRTTFSISSFDAAFVMIDANSGAAIAFGGDHVDDRTEQALTTMARNPAIRGHEGMTDCKRSTLFSRDCITYRQLKNSSLVLAGVTNHDRLVSRWVQESRPIWLFAAFVILGGFASSSLIYAWARQRHTDRLRLSAALEELRLSYAAKSNFMAHLCHELRTPLNSIVGFSDIMRNKLFGNLDERYRTYAEDIHASAVHLHNIASDIMDVERIERGELTHEPGTVDLNKTIADAGRMLSVLATKRSVRIELKPLAEPAIVALNPHRATQIAVNLISNAVKYSEASDRVLVSIVRDEDSRLILTVTDEGIGMTQEEIAYSEHPFGHPADRRVGRHDSIGLGLPIVRGLLAGIGGCLHIVSEKHKGTTVSAVFTR